MRTHRVRSGDGVGLHVIDLGPESAPPIVFIHGWSQHHLSWSKQLESDLTGSFRLIALDLRGHGASDAPDPVSAYDNSAPWAGDVYAIFDQLKLERPLLVGWSMGGWVLNDYLRIYGDAEIAGAVWVGARARVGDKADLAMNALRKNDVVAAGMYSENHAEQLRAAIAFVKACAAGPLSKTDLAFMVGFNMLVSPHVRRASRERHEDYRPDLSSMKKPALVIQGAAERLCLRPFYEELLAALPHAGTHVYAGSGHLPFWEEPERFNADLAAFARQAFGETS